jgi:hypothetical protein
MQFYQIIRLCTDVVRWQDMQFLLIYHLFCKANLVACETCNVDFSLTAITNETLQLGTLFLI